MNRFLLERWRNFLSIQTLQSLPASTDAMSVRAFNTPLPQTKKFKLKYRDGKKSCGPLPPPKHFPNFSGT